MSKLWGNSVLSLLYVQTCGKHCRWMSKRNRWSLYLGTCGRKRWNDSSSGGQLPRSVGGLLQLWDHPDHSLYRCICHLYWTVLYAKYALTPVLVLGENRLRNCDWNRFVSFLAHLHNVWQINWIKLSEDLNSKVVIVCVMTVIVCIVRLHKLSPIFECSQRPRLLGQTCFFFALSCLVRWQLFEIRKLAFLIMFAKFQADWLNFLGNQFD